MIEKDGKLLDILFSMNKYGRNHASHLVLACVAKVVYQGIQYEVSINDLVWL
jgi:hypothetical protein